jgi:hypothetical protein
MAAVVQFPKKSAEVEGRKRQPLFAVDRRALVRALRLGLNEGVGYLILAAFSGGDNRTTKASTNAIEQYTGIARKRAKAAVESLERAGLIHRPEGTKGTLRKLVPAHEVPGCEGYREPVSDAERALFDFLQNEGPRRLPSYADWMKKGGRSNPADLAGLLLKKGLLRKSGSTWEAIPYDPEAVEKPDWIWLPVALVTGVDSEETSPLERVRNRSDPLLLQMLLDIYHQQDLPANCGMHWKTIRQDYEKVPVGKRGEFDIFALKTTGKTVSFFPFSLAHVKGDWNAQGALSQFWDRLNSLTNMGLADFVPHVVEANTDQAEVLMPLGFGCGEPGETAVGKAAHKAGLAMVTSGQYDHVSRELGYNPWLLPMLRDMSKAEVFGILRARYRTDTSAKAQWYGKMLKRSADMVERFEATEARAKGISEGQQSGT